MDKKTCIGCGAQFITNNRQQRRCKTHCNRTEQSRHFARATIRSTHQVEFIGVDGEGVTRSDGTHDYVLLSVGIHSLHRDGVRLTWRDIFPFLYARFLEHPEAAYVGFALGYDFAQWFRDFPENRARMLLTDDGVNARRRKRSGKNTVPFPVYLENWEFDMLGGKRFKLRPHNGSLVKLDKHGKNVCPWMYVCDAFAFYQSSFLAAIDPAAWSDPIVTPDEFEKIARGKAARSDAHLDADMIEYNTLENVVMARMMTHLNEGFVRIGIRLNRDQWYGPGQAVARWLDAINAPTREQVEEIIPQEIRHAAQKSYYGGWFEIFAHGHIPGETYEYDINSAYPAVIANLPCLLHGTWTSGSGYRDYLRGEYTLVHAEVEGNDTRCGAMLHRTPAGRVLRPQRTAGWYWRHELHAAEQAKLMKVTHADGWFAYQPCSCPPPLRAIADLYQERLRVGKKTPEGRALKLVFNSSYGKMAQSIGIPKYSNPVYASLITAGCRTAILDAIATHPTRTKDLLMIATDGVYFRTPHPGLPLSKSELGLWDETQRQNMTLMMPGIYWDDTTRERVRVGESPKLKSRGINAADLAAAIAEIDAAFTEFSRQYARRRTEGLPTWPTFEATVKFSMVTAKQALARGDWQQCGQIAVGSTRTLNANPHTKRSDIAMYRSHGALRSSPYYQQDPFEATPYERHFGDEMNELLERQDAVTPDGSAWTLLHHALSE